MRAARQCDQLAANPTDPRKASEGVSYEALKSQAKEAVEACTQAVQQFPTEVRYQISWTGSAVDRSPEGFRDLERKWLLNVIPQLLTTSVGST